MDTVDIIIFIALVVAGLTFLALPIYSGFKYVMSDDPKDSITTITKITVTKNRQEPNDSESTKQEEPKP